MPDRPVDAGHSRILQDSNDDSNSSGQQLTAAIGGSPPPRKRNRVFLWVFLAIQAIFLIWVIIAGVSLPQSGVAIQVGLWVVSFPWRRWLAPTREARVNAGVDHRPRQSQRHVR